MISQGEPVEGHLQRAAGLSFLILRKMAEGVDDGKWVHLEKIAIEIAPHEVCLLHGQNVQGEGMKVS